MLRFNKFLSFAVILILGAVCACVEPALAQTIPTSIFSDLPPANGQPDPESGDLYWIIDGSGGDQLGDPAAGAGSERDLVYWDADQSRWELQLRSPATAPPVDPETVLPASLIGVSGQSCDDSQECFEDLFDAPTGVGHADGTNADEGLAIRGVDAEGNYQDAFDVATQEELDDHAGAANAHHPEFTPNSDLVVDYPNYVAGHPTGTLCPPGQYPSGVDGVTGDSIGCTELGGGLAGMRTDPNTGGAEPQETTLSETAYTLVDFGTAPLKTVGGSDWTVGTDEICYSGTGGYPVSISIDTSSHRLVGAAQYIDFRVGMGASPVADGDAVGPVFRRALSDYGLGAAVHALTLGDGSTTPICIGLLARAENAPASVQLIGASLIVSGGGGGGGGGGPTNLGTTIAADSVTITNDSGSPATLPAATATTAGVLSAEDWGGLSDGWCDGVAVIEMTEPGLFACMGSYDPDNAFGSLRYFEYNPERTSGTNPDPGPAIMEALATCLDPASILNLDTNGSGPVTGCTIRVVPGNYTLRAPVFINAGAAESWFDGTLTLDFRGSTFFTDIPSATLTAVTITPDTRGVCNFANRGALVIVTDAAGLDDSTEGTGELGENLPQFCNGAEWAAGNGALTIGGPAGATAHRIELYAPAFVLDDTGGDEIKRQRLLVLDATRGTEAGYDDGGLNQVAIHGGGARGSAPVDQIAFDIGGPLGGSGGPPLAETRCEGVTLNNTDVDFFAGPAFWVRNCSDVHLDAVHAEHGANIRIGEDQAGEQLPQGVVLTAPHLGGSDDLPNMELLSGQSACTGCELPGDKDAFDPGVLARIGGANSPGVIFNSDGAIWRSYDENDGQILLGNIASWVQSGGLFDAADGHTVTGGLPFIVADAEAEIGFLSIDSARTILPSDGLLADLSARDTTADQSLCLLGVEPFGCDPSGEHIHTIAQLKEFFARGVGRGYITETLTATTSGTAAGVAFDLPVPDDGSRLDIDLEWREGAQMIWNHTGAQPSSGTARDGVQIDFGNGNQAEGSRIVLRNLNYRRYVDGVLGGLTNTSHQAVALVNRATAGSVRNLVQFWNADISHRDDGSSSIVGGANPNSPMRVEHYGGRLHGPIGWDVKHICDAADCSGSGTFFYGTTISSDSEFATPRCVKGDSEGVAYFDGGSVRECYFDMQGNSAVYLNGTTFLGMPASLAVGNDAAFVLSEASAAKGDFFIRGAGADRADFEGVVLINAGFSGSFDLDITAMDCGSPWWYSPAGDSASGWLVINTSGAAAYGSGRVRIQGPTDAGGICGPRDTALLGGAELASGTALAIDAGFRSLYYGTSEGVSVGTATQAAAGSNHVAGYRFTIVNDTAVGACADASNDGALDGGGSAVSTCEWDGFSWGPAGGTTNRGTFVLGTASIASGACASLVTDSAPGFDPLSDTFEWFPQSSMSGITGYTPNTNGGLIIYKRGSSGQVSVEVCNPTAAAITPGALTLNWKQR